MSAGRVAVCGSRAWLGALTFALLMGAASAASAHDSHGDAAMWTVCEGATLGAACRYDNAHHDVFKGTCRSMSGHLACVRNQPIERASDADAVVVVAPRPAGLQAMVWMAVALVPASLLLLGLLLRRMRLAPDGSIEAT